MTWPDHEPTYRDSDRSIDVQASLDAMTRQDAEGCVKTWEDLERYRALIAYYQPDLVIELGTFKGRFTTWLANETGSRVITVDINPVTHHEPAGFAPTVEPVLQLVGSSIDPSIVERIHFEALHAERPLLVLDSWHSGPHVLAELESYHDLIPVWGYIVVEDGIIRWNPHELAAYGGSGPLDGIEAFIRKHTNWSSDKDIELMHPQTQHPDGWLVRRA